MVRDTDNGRKLIWLLAVKGRVGWQIEGNAGYVFRAQRIHSLYHPETGLTR